MWTAKCGCIIDGWIKDGCFGFHGEDEYCECPPSEVEDLEIVKPCDLHQPHSQDAIRIKPTPGRI